MPKSLIGKLSDVLKVRRIIRQINALVPNTADQKRVSAADAQWLVDHLYKDEDKQHKARMINKIKFGEIMLRNDGVWACNTCGGNCGQCGDTAFYGNIGLSMDRLVKVLLHD